jgi:hypothetical protein
MLHEQSQEARLDRGTSGEELPKLSGSSEGAFVRSRRGATFIVETLRKLLPHLPSLKND